jgi:hypothetical protein
MTAAGIVHPWGRKYNAQATMTHNKAYNNDNGNDLQATAAMIDLNDPSHNQD